MSALIFRFRDINIPDGETIRRHRAKIESHGCVWWGWIKRRHESFPEHFLAKLAHDLETPPSRVYLYHSEEDSLYPAALRDVSALPGGERIQTPEVQKTPNYMAEAELPAWLELSEIEDPLPVPFKLRVTELPTLAQMREVDKDLLDNTYTNASELRLSTATLYQAVICEKD